MYDYYCDYKIIYKINFIHMFLKSPIQGYQYWEVNFCIRKIFFV